MADRPHPKRMTLADLEREWNARGPQAIATVRELDPSAFVALIAEAVAAGDDEGEA